MITILLLAHALMAVALLGAVTHQALSVVPQAASTGRRSFFARFRNVNAPAYAGPIVVLFVLTATLGAFLYPQYRVDVRVLLEDTNSRSANGIFEIKEHFIAVGFGALPIYWQSWRTPLAPESATDPTLSDLDSGVLRLVGLRRRSPRQQFQGAAASLSEGLSRVKMFLPACSAPSTTPASGRSTGRCSTTTRKRARFYLTAHADDGPAILWYGWLATAALMSIPVALLVPRRIADRVWNELSWLVVVGSIVAIFIHESRWFI